MPAKNQEALDKRAGLMHTAPASIRKSELNAFNEPCKTILGQLYTIDEGDSFRKKGTFTSGENLEVLRCLGLPNGIDMLFMDIEAGKARLEVHFFNGNYLKQILDDFATELSPAKKIFPIIGGRRVKAGADEGNVKVVKIEPDTDKTVLVLMVEPIGDYSTYTLRINRDDYPKFDPMFEEIEFKFRPGCFNTNCRPDWEPAPKPKKDPVIDYLAKDYDSFKHTMITAMMERVPGWQPTSEADLDQTLLELFCAAADELSDFQDRVMNEAYLGSARKRVSLSRHAWLMDYHINQGNQASTWLALELVDGFDLDIPISNPGYPPVCLIAWAGSGDMESPSSSIYITRTERHFSYLYNEFNLYTWGGSIRTLVAGTTEADLRPPANASAVFLRDAIVNGELKYLLIQENLNPQTGEERGRNPAKRQVVKLITGTEGAKILQDPLTKEELVRVRWEEKDRLKDNYCFAVECSGITIENVSCFYGNIVEIYHGRPIRTDKGRPARIVFREPGSVLGEGEYYFERIRREIKANAEENPDWVICSLPENPLAYENVYEDGVPEGDIPPKSTLDVKIRNTGSYIFDPWIEQANLIHSDDGDETGNHFVVETNEEGKSLIRFGNGINGKKLPQDAEVHCFYQVGRGTDGNIGADKIRNFNNLIFQEIKSCRNPFDITNGRDPELAAEIIRRVPEAYRARQLRAVTLKDYKDRAEELNEVSRAAARYVWTGSWRSVQIVIDPAGSDELKDEVREKVMAHLDAVRLIGEDLEIRQPKFVPLKINVSLCIHPDYWPEDIKYILEQEFSDGYTPEGRQAFFHPDLWTFGQEIKESQILGRVQSIRGIDHVINITMKRWNDPAANAVLKLQFNEIILVKNDPDHLEKGFIFFDILGGRK